VPDLQAVEAGQLTDREAFIARYPDLVEHLRSFFAAQDQERASSVQPSVPVSHKSPAPEETISLAAEPAAYANTLASSPPAPPYEPGREGSAPWVKVRYFGDYELLEEIARGGMGVVYKARQVSLNRVVALKMILAGQLAREDDVRRFYTEAEAAANLEHPGIVPIYEVGQHEGQHYFSMGFIEGESLAAKVAEGPLPPREAAELVLKVAEAIAYAHERGVIHRDLKPGNILLDKNGQARVTDFGLAKRTSAADHSGVEALTTTGQILGTPSYMPPEQAAGRLEEIGPLADVYSLGAVLYTLLTGRPPFQSASVMDTLMAVLEQEPVPPRQLSAGVPVDLESICLKCLEKASKRRYVSALELAADLDRYLAGEPVIARPVGRIVRAARWVARHPAKVGAYGFAVLAVVFLDYVSV
jgi:serine/threonine protein kinase